MIKNTFDAKKSQTAAVYARNGGFQPGPDTFGRKWRYRSPAATNVLIKEKGYDVTGRGIVDKFV